MTEPLPTILVDTREKFPLLVTEWSIKVKRATLKVGDYTLYGYSKEIAVEYKSRNDWFTWLNEKDDKRFMSQVRGLGFVSRRLILVSANYLPIPPFAKVSPYNVQKKVGILASLSIPVIFAGNKNNAKEALIHFLRAAKHLTDKKRLKTEEE